MVVSVGVRERLTQEEGVEYDVTFASVAKPMSYKALFPIGADLDLEIEQMDVKTAFLYGDTDARSTSTSLTT
jgi:hypothetical protein